MRVLLPCLLLCACATTTTNTPAPPPPPPATPAPQTEPAQVTVAPPMAERAAAQLRFDGLYVHPGEGYAEYLRFWPDGRVVEASSTATAEQAATWLDTTYGTGQYKVDGAHIKFQDISQYGVVDYEGTITSDGLTLDWTSHINNKSGSNNAYSFVPVTFAK